LCTGSLRHGRHERLCAELLGARNGRDRGRLQVEQHLADQRGVSGALRPHTHHRHLVPRDQRRGGLGAGLGVLAGPLASALCRVDGPPRVPRRVPVGGRRPRARDHPPGEQVSDAQDCLYGPLAGRGRGRAVRGGRPPPAARPPRPGTHIHVRDAAHRQRRVGDRRRGAVHPDVPRRLRERHGPAHPFPVARLHALFRGGVDTPKQDCVLRHASPRGAAVLGQRRPLRLQHPGPLAVHARGLDVCAAAGRRRSGGL
ncbi:hypothetical protein IWQ56_006821, partial [Coemansia nantahalensis]